MLSHGSRVKCENVFLIAFCGAEVQLGEETQPGSKRPDRPRDAGRREERSNIVFSKCVVFEEAASEVPTQEEPSRRGVRST
ncbi:hypothetical protein KUCAC02_037840, partial [Chaenocephalus aceratus]